MLPPTAGTGSLPLDTVVENIAEMAKSGNLAEAFLANTRASSRMEFRKLEAIFYDKINEMCDTGLITLNSLFALIESKSSIKAVLGEEVLAHIKAIPKSDAELMGASSSTSTNHAKALPVEDAKAPEQTDDKAVLQIFEAYIEQEEQNLNDLVEREKNRTQQLREEAALVIQESKRQAEIERIEMQQETQRIQELAELAKKLFKEEAETRRLEEQQAEDQRLEEEQAEVLVYDDEQDPNVLNETNNDWLQFIFDMPAIQKSLLAAIALGTVILLTCGAAEMIVLATSLVVGGVAGFAMNFFQSNPSSQTPENGDSTLPPNGDNCDYHH